MSNRSRNFAGWHAVLVQLCSEIRAAISSCTKDIALDETSKCLSSADILLHRAQQLWVTDISHEYERALPETSGTASVEMGGIQLPEQATTSFTEIHESYGSPEQHGA